MNIDEILKRTALMKREVPYVENFVAEKAEHPTLNEATIIGSLAAKLYISPQFKGRLLRITDVDVFYQKLPAELRAQVTEEHLTNLRRSRFGSRDHFFRQELSEFTCYKFKPTGYEEMDIFEDAIANLKVSKDVPIVHVPVETSEGDLILNLAHPGLLMACYLNPQAINDKRANRARFMYKTFTEGERFGVDISEFHTVCANVLNTNGITGDAANETRDGIRHKYATRDTPFYNFVFQVTSP